MVSIYDIYARSTIPDRTQWFLMQSIWGFIIFSGIFDDKNSTAWKFYGNPNRPYYTNENRVTEGFIILSLLDIVYNAKVVFLIVVKKQWIPEEI